MALKKIFKLSCAENKEFTGPPAPWGVLYAPPNADGSRKNCGNCFMWVKNGRCVIHGKDIQVKKTQVCGYHVYGNPFEEWIDNVKEPMDKKMTGLTEVGKGTSCDICFHFNEGKCYAVASKDGGKSPAEVDPKGCCARWTSQK